jgi:hypothetical protein
VTRPAIAAVRAFLRSKLRKFHSALLEGHDTHHLSIRWVMLGSIATVHMHELAQLTAPFETDPRVCDRNGGPFVTATATSYELLRVGGSDVSGAVAGSVARMILV